MGSLIKDEGNSQTGGFTAIGGSTAINRPIFLDNNSPHFEEVLFHETIHNMGYGELGAYGAQFAAGYETQSFKTAITYKNSILDPQDVAIANINIRNELISDIRKDAKRLGVDISPYFDESKTEVTDIEGLVKCMKEYGNKIIGTDKNNK